MGDLASEHRGGCLCTLTVASELGPVKFGTWHQYKQAIRRSHLVHLKKYLNESTKLTLGHTWTAGLITIYLSFLLPVLTFGLFVYFCLSVLLSLGLTGFRGQCIGHASCCVDCPTHFS